jgi:hypothetical protein
MVCSPPSAPKRISPPSNRARSPIQDRFGVDHSLGHSCPHRCIPLFLTGACQKPSRRSFCWENSEIVCRRRQHADTASAGRRRSVASGRGSKPLGSNPIRNMPQGSQVPRPRARRTMSSHRRSTSGTASRANQSPRRAPRLCGRAVAASSADDLAASPQRSMTSRPLQ